MSKFFIDRPIFAGVISFIVTMVGALAVVGLPIAQYPEITPPTVQVSCFYPGASAEVLSETVASPIEQQVIGVENMLYMSSQSSNDGTYNLTVTFAVGTNLDMAQVLVQNRVNLALPLLPSEVKQTGVSVKKKSPSILLVVNLTSPKGTRDQLYLSNFATIRLRDELAQVNGVGDIWYMGQLDYSMRIWLDPDKLVAREVSPGELVAVLREQNVQVAAGAVGRPPIPMGQDFQYTLTTQGRLIAPDQFGEMIVKVGSDGATVRLREVVSDQRTENGQLFGGIQVGAKNEDTTCLLDGKPSVGLTIYQLPGSNALATADRIRARLEELKSIFPPDVEYSIVYDTTPFVKESIQEVFKALRDAIILVAIVVLVFLQSWRATLIPLIAVPVAIVGTFSVMAACGFSLNNLSLFGLVLAIGIVVDDAIVVVEAVEHHLEHGLAPREAALKAMSEVTGPIIAISLVLMCVFIPCLFISGITGQFFQQFALTISASTFFSAINSLTLSPALSALLLRPKDQQKDLLSRLIQFLFGWFFKLFNTGFTAASNAYATSVGWLIRASVLVLVVYVGLLYLTYLGFTKVPAGFIPPQDKGYLLVDVRLPDSASLERSIAVMNQLQQICMGSGPKESGSHDAHAKGDGIPGVIHTITIGGQSMVQNSIGSNYGSMFVILDEFHHRHGPELSADHIAAVLRKACDEQIPGAKISVFGAPAVDGLGNAGGFKVMVRDPGNTGFKALEAAANGMSKTGEEQPGVVALINGFRAETPQLYADIDRVKCKRLGVPLNEAFLALQVYLGGYYTNDFNEFGRTWQVNLQGDPSVRMSTDSLAKFRVRNASGKMVSLATLTEIKDSSGPSLIVRYNGVTAASMNGATLPSLSSGDVIRTIERVAKQELPPGTDYQWTELTLLQILAGNTALVVFAISVVLVFLVLAAQYESLSLPLAVVLVLPMCILSSVAGIAMAKLDINIFVQIGFIVLVGLASKNAILIVEFAKEKQTAGSSPLDAAVEACRSRLRPIMMTSFAFILGVVPLAIAVGAGAEMRRPLGIAVFAGMLGVTVFGLFLTPVFYFVMMKIFGKSQPAAPAVAKDAPAH